MVNGQRCASLPRGTNVAAERILSLPRGTSALARSTGRDPGGKLKPWATQLELLLRITTHNNKQPKTKPEAEETSTTVLSLSLSPTPPQLPLAASSSSTQGSFALSSSCSLLPARLALSFPSRLPLLSPARRDGRPASFGQRREGGVVFAGGDRRSARPGGDGREGGASSRSAFVDPLATGSNPQSAEGVLGAFWWVGMAAVVMACGAAAARTAVPWWTADGGALVDRSLCMND